VPSPFHSKGYPEGPRQVVLWLLCHHSRFTFFVDNCQSLHRTPRKCHLSQQSDQHLHLIRRFPGSTFDEKAAEFSRSAVIPLCSNTLRKTCIRGKHTIIYNKKKIIGTFPTAVWHSHLQRPPRSHSNSPLSNAHNFQS
jgi:hypothetical protein